MHTVLISAAQLQALMREGGPLMVFDCSADLADPAAGPTAWHARRIVGSVHASLETALSDPGLRDPDGRWHPHADARSGGRHPLPSRERLAVWLSSVGFSNEQQAVVYDRNGTLFAGRLWWMLKWAGHEAVAVLDGGLAAWEAAGGDTESGDAISHFQSNFRLGPELRRLDRASDVESRLGSDRQTLVDARGAARYRGEQEPIDPRAGHIPGALNRPFSDNFTAEGLFKPAAQLREEWNTLLRGRDPESVVHQCGSGVSALANQVAMEAAGLPPGSLYAGSWSEWSSDPARPIATGQT